MKAIYLADWSEVGRKGLVEDFNHHGEAVDLTDGCEILLAYYSYEHYSGDAFVLFRKEGKLFEVNGGHCSCHGLEGQWEPEETSVDALRHRMDKGQLGTGYGTGNMFAAELRLVLDQVGEA
ncbi:hypothetical protein [Xanthomonas campestris]|uniref:hypothetical protein n=1 Tax=Xanthomonas campestris TaxID=339 RepID=UPI0023684D19|nr:hypothetical protein [Xanthomonas campestris]WDI91943.1 hypothetical protein JH280_11395 [Xanthomonas campestris]